jgi:hypothetical protein
VISSSLARSGHLRHRLNLASAGDAMGARFMSYWLMYARGNPGEPYMTESQSQVVSESQVQAAPQGLYNFNLNISGQLQLSGQETDTVQDSEQETIQTTGAGECQSQVVSESQVQAAPQGLYNFNLNISGQLQLSGHETDTVQDSEQETTQTAG